MKYKVGDKVKIREDLKEGTNFKEYVTDKMERLAGTIVTIERVSEGLFKGYEINKDNGSCLWSEDMFESIKKPTKEEILEMPLGTIIKTDEKEHNTYVKVEKNKFSNDYNDYIYEDDINEDLSLDYNTVDIKIIEIQEPTYEAIYKADEEIKEMTIAEIEEELGYPIKVIKED